MANNEWQKMLNDWWLINYKGWMIYLPITHNEKWMTNNEKWMTTNEKWMTNNEKWITNNEK